MMALIWRKTMYSKETILSIFNKKGTLLKWLQNLEDTLKNAEVTSINFNELPSDKLSLTISFKDGTSVTTPAINAIQGPKGDVGINWKGEWVEGDETLKDDSYSYNGSSYIAQVDNPVGAPGSNSDWGVLARAGSAGSQHLYLHIYESGNNINVYFMNSDPTNYSSLEEVYNATQGKGMWGTGTKSQGASSNSIVYNIGMIILTNPTVIYDTNALAYETNFRARSSGPKSIGLGTNTDLSAHINNITNYSPISVSNYQSQEYKNQQVIQLI